MKTSELFALSEKVNKIVVDAGEAIMEIYNNSSDFEIEQKSDDSPLTIADRKSNEIICEALSVLDPKFPIVSEENKAIDFEERNAYEYFWLVDPLDGTKEFIKRNGEFTVNVALIHQNKAVLGCVYVPAIRELYFAAFRNGAYRIDDTKCTRIQASLFRTNDETLSIVCSRSHVNEATLKYMERFNNPKQVPKGSSLKFLSIASGRADIYPRLGPTMEWDTAAAQIILEEAGGSVIHADTKAQLQYNKENLLNPHFIAYGRKVEL